MTVAEWWADLQTRNLWELLGVVLVVRWSILALEAFVRGFVAESRKFEQRTHLERCPNCRTVFHVERKTD